MRPIDLVLGAWVRGGRTLVRRRAGIEERVEYSDTRSRVTNQPPVEPNRPLLDLRADPPPRGNP